jgi:2',3'-cyclic-nucleotide 2'-phosphodiesterase (5'-nucleotidase family)
MLRFAVALLFLIVTAPGLLAADKYEGAIKLVVIHTNDVHGGIDRSAATFMNPEFPPMLGGGAALTTYVDAVREQSREDGSIFLLMDSGDIFQGTPVGTGTKGTAVIEFMNQIGYDVWTLGNHEFDQGWENAKRLAELAEFPSLAANLVYEDTGEIVEFVEPYAIFERQGIRVGVVGLVTSETPKMSFPEHVEGLEFLPEVPVLREYIKELREEKDCDLVIGLFHAGLPYDVVTDYQKMMEQEEQGTAPLEAEERDEVYGWGTNTMEIVHQVEGLDIVFAGHIHKGYDHPWEDPDTHTLVFQTYGRGSGLEHIEFYIDAQTKSLIGYEEPSERGVLITLFEDQFWPEAEAESLIEYYVAQAEEGMDEVIGETVRDITRGGEGETLMGNLVCDAMLEATGADFAFTNLGGIRDEIVAGPITPRDVFQVLPFGNKLVVFTVDGELLKEIVEYRVSAGHHGLYIAGGEVVYNKTREDYDRLTRFMIQGKPWDPDATYKVATTDFLAQGNAGLTMLPDVPDEQKFYTGIATRDALINYIKKHSPIEVTYDGRWVRDDEATMSDSMRRALAMSG